MNGIDYDAAIAYSQAYRPDSVMRKEIYDALVQAQKDAKRIKGLEEALRINSESYFDLARHLSLALSEVESLRAKIESMDAIVKAAKVIKDNEAFHWDKDETLALIEAIEQFEKGE